jgi:hypothetical protein
MSTFWKSKLSTEEISEAAAEGMKMRTKMEESGQGKTQEAVRG